MTSNSKVDCFCKFLGEAIETDLKETQGSLDFDIPLLME